MVRDERDSSPKGYRNIGMLVLSFRYNNGILWCCGGLFVKTIFAIINEGLLFFFCAARLYWA